MGLMTVSCSEKHTPLSPSKNTIRRDMLNKSWKYCDVITISHGALDVLNILGWQGRIQPCDIDPGVREAIHGMLKVRYSYDGSKAGTKRRGCYPDLKILPPGESIQQTVRDYCAEHGTARLGIVDVDLAVGMVKCWDILRDVLATLQDHNYNGKTFLTFRNGRADGFGKDAIKARIDWLRKRLPRTVKVASYTTYTSERFDQNARWSPGSPMCIVELQHKRWFR